MRDITVERFSVGIEVTGGGSHHLNEVALRHHSDFHCGNGGVGIQLTQTTANRMNGSELTANQGVRSAISLTGSGENTLQSNWIDRQPPVSPIGLFIGVHLFEGAVANQVVGNTVLDHTAGGIVVVEGATGNRLEGNEAFDNTPFDLRDDNPDCDADVWQGNQFGTANQPACIQ